MEPNIIEEFKGIIDDGAEACVRKPLGKVFDGMDSLLSQTKEKKDDDVVDSE